MELPICAVFDKKSGLFDNPFVVRHTAEASREWNHVKTLPDTRYGKHPEDYELIHIGTFNATLGTFENLTKHEQISSGV